MVEKRKLRFGWCLTTAQDTELRIKINNVQKLFKLTNTLNHLGNNCIGWDYPFSGACRQTIDSPQNLNW